MQKIDFDTVVSEIKNDLPWVENIRLVVGPLTSRESVKDRVLAQTEIIPAHAVQTLSDLATEILNKNKVSVDKSLSNLSQADALERIAETSMFKSVAAELASHLRHRTVSLKLARYLSELDRFYTSAEDLDAIIDYLQTKDAQLGAFVQIVATLWRAGELQPWGDGAVLRRVLMLNEQDTQSYPKKIYLWGFFEFTPLEEEFLATLVRQGVKCILFVPQACAAVLEKQAAELGVSVVSLPPVQNIQNVKFLHSVWDEIEFLKDELTALRAKNTPWDSIGIFVPNDDLHKRLVRQKLYEWNVPIQDPTLSGAWKDQPEWMWWRDLFRVVASGLKVDDVRAWLAVLQPPSETLRLLFQELYERGVHGGASHWQKISQKFDLPALKLSIEAVRLFSRSMTPQDFSDACKQLLEKNAEVFGEHAVGGEILSEFAEHLVLERPYLDAEGKTFTARLPKYVLFFEEFLEKKARTLSVRADNGIWFVGHGVWVPKQLERVFVLSANVLKRATPNADIWNWEGLEVRRAWEKVHLGLPWAERVLRDEAFLLHGMQMHDEISYFVADHSVTGGPNSRSVLFKQLIQAATIQDAKTVAHVRVGWDKSIPLPQTNWAEVIVPDFQFEKTPSISAFEDYLKCPFIFYARHVLKIRREEELGLDADGRARGNLLHKVLERFLQTEIQTGEFLELDDARAALKKLLQEEAARTPMTGMFRHKPLVDKAIELIETYLDQWLKWEIENRKKHPTLKPMAVEVPLVFELEPGFVLRGKADRVDSDGKHSVVIDYKSGTAPFIGKELASGIGAQLLMYAQALRLKHGLEPGAAFYLSLKRKVEASKGIFLKAHQKVLHSAHARNSGLVDLPFDTLLESPLQRWREAAQKLRSGNFSPNPARGKKECDVCDYSKICGRPTDLTDERGDE